MDAILLDWLKLLLRWAHVVIGIGWIGTSFYFVWLDASLRRRAGEEAGIAGESWMVHGGGFYHLRKYLVAPETLPKTLHWFKYEAYFTWVTGMLLLVAIYYFGAETYLIDRRLLDLSPAAAIAVSAGSLLAGWLAYDLLCRSPIGRHTAWLAVAVLALTVAAAWGYTQVFAGRAAFLHAGAFIGTLMSANVFFVIIPNQRKVTAALLEGRTPAAALGQQAKQRSLHNNYLTLPVVLMMISNHYPLLYGQAESWVFVAGAILVGGLVRHFINRHDAGAQGWRTAWLLPAAAAVLVALVAFSGWRPGGDGAPQAGSATAQPVALAEVMGVVRRHCVACHSAWPSNPDFAAPPAGVVFDTPRQIAAEAERILAVAVDSDVMPLGNLTGMTEAERALLGRWLRARE